MQENEKLEIIRSLRFPVFFIVIIWVIKIFESISGIDLSFLGLIPLDLKGVRGILFFPLIHANWQHLINNTLPLFILTWALFYSYRTIAFKVFFLIYFIHGFWLWFFGRDAFHIGASGLIYGLGSFIFVSGIIRKNTNLLAVSLLVAFLYGGLVWGIFPYEQYISWEGHLTGLIAGIVLAYYYKDYGPSSNMGQQTEIEEDEEHSEEPESEANEQGYWNSPELEDKEEI